MRSMIGTSLGRRLLPIHLRQKNQRQDKSRIDIAVHRSHGKEYWIDVTIREMSQKDGKSVIEMGKTGKDEEVQGQIPSRGD